jgi:hypothetical protein
VSLFLLVLVFLFDGGVLLMNGGFGGFDEFVDEVGFGRGGIEVVFGEVFGDGGGGSVFGEAGVFEEIHWSEKENG